MIRDGKMSTEIRRRVTYQRIRGDAEADQPLEEFVLVDGNGRVQIPRDYLDRLNIGDKARVQVEDGKVTIIPGG